MNQKHAETLKHMGVQLPAPITPLGAYKTATRSGDLLFVSGLGPFKDGEPVVGLVGADLSIAQAQEAARLTMIQILACVDEACGLENVEQCLRLTVYVRAEPTFAFHPEVANGASDLLLVLFGADRLPARSALGVYSLPMGIPVEIDSIFQLKTVDR